MIIFSKLQFCISTIQLKLNADDNIIITPSLLNLKKLNV